MDITLYINQSEKNKIAKTLLSGATFSGALRDPSGVTDPEILLQTENPTGYNYMYIPAFGRYYYITALTSVRNGLWMVRGHADVLMSFSEEIKKSKGVVSTGKITGSRYLSGAQWVATQKNKTDILQFPTGLLETGQYILITSGG